MPEVYISSHCEIVVKPIRWYLHIPITHVLLWSTCNTLSKMKYWTVHFSNECDLLKWFNREAYRSRIVLKYITRQCFNSCLPLLYIGAFAKHLMQKCVSTEPQFSGLLSWISEIPPTIVTTTLINSRNSVSTSTCGNILILVTEINSPLKTRSSHWDMYQWDIIDWVRI